MYILCFTFLALSSERKEVETSFFHQKFSENYIDSSHTSSIDVFAQEHIIYSDYIILFNGILRAIVFFKDNSSLHSRNSNTTLNLQQL